MLTLTILSVSLSCASASDINDNATVTAQEDGLQLEINENLYLENEKSFDNDAISSSDEDDLSSSSEIEIRDKDTGSSNVDVKAGDTVTIQGNAPYDYYYLLQKATKSDFDDRETVVNYLTLGSSSWSDVATYTFSQSDAGKTIYYRFYMTNGRYGEFSNTLAYTVSGSGSTPSDPVQPVSDATASLKIYDAAYPLNTTVNSVGDYSAVIMYDLTKSGDGFSDEMFTVTVTDGDGVSQSYDMALNSQNTLGSVKITEDNTYTFVVTYTATLNGKEYTVKSNVLTYDARGTSNVPANESDASASLRIYDAAYPLNTTVNSVGDYSAVIMYDLTKSGDGFSDEMFTVTVTDGDGVSQSYDMALNSQNTLGSVKITEDNTYAFVVTYTATLNGKEYTVKSNVLTYEARGTSNVSANESDASASLRIYDAAYPLNTTVNSVGDYSAVIMYDLIKSGDGFSDEMFTVTVTDGDGVSQSYDMALNSQNTLGSVKITEDNTYAFVVTYTATLNGKEYTVKSNTLSYIARETSNTSEPAKNETSDDNTTDGNETQSDTPSDIKLIIRDANNITASSLNVAQNYTPVLEYYVTVPSGELLTSEIVILCDGEGIMTIDKENIAGGRFVKVNTGKVLNESGTHVFTAKYKYFVFMGSGDDVESNSVTYIVSNSTSEVPQSNVTDDKNETSDSNKTSDKNETSSDENKTEDVSLTIRDAAHPGDSTVTVEDEYSPVIEYLVVKPSGDFVSDEIIITCNGEAVGSVSSPADRQYTRAVLTKKLNETGTYVIKAQYKYYVFMGLASDALSNEITYIIKITNSTSPAANTTEPSSGDKNESGNSSVPVANTTEPSSGDKNESGNSTNPVSNQTESNETSLPEKTASKISIIKLDSDLKITGVLSDYDGNAIADAELICTAGSDKISVKTDSNGKFTVQLKENANAVVRFEGNDNYTASDITFGFESDVSEDVRLKSKFNVSEAQTIDTYAVDFNAGEKGNVFQFRLTDSEGNAIADAPVQFAYKTVILNRTTDKNGIVSLGVSTQFADSYLCALSYLGDDKHDAAFVAFNFKLSKKPITITAKAKTFKSGVKTKKYTVTLKTKKCASRDGKVYLKSGKKVTLKINGKTYAAKINAKGKATFKITKLSKKGKFTALIKFAGDKTYDAASKKVKITIK